MDAKQLVRTAALAGEIMLSNGAETYRVEDTMSRILMTHKFKAIDAFVVPSGIFLSVDGDESGVITVVRRIKNRTFNLSKISEVNDFSRKLVAGTISQESAAEILDKINWAPAYPLYVKALATAIACFCFAYMFGGTVISAFCALLVSAAAFMFNFILRQKNVSGVLATMLTGAFIAFLAVVLANTGIGGIQSDKIIIGGIMQLVPGLGLTNGIRDAFEGDYMAATGRLLDAILVAVSIAVGVGTVLKLFMLFG